MGSLLDRPSATAMTAPNQVRTADGFFTASAQFQRPADTNAYAQYDRVANSTGAATVLEFPNVMRATGEAVRIERVRMRKTSITLANASFRLHFFRTPPIVAVHDNGAFSSNAGATLAVADIAGYIGTVDVIMDKAGTVGSRGVGVPSAGSGITAEAAGTVGHERSLWCVVEALAAYAPASGESFTVTLEAARS